MKCAKCNATGQCQTCKGSGRSGYFLIYPKISSNPCWQCMGSGRCNLCVGQGVLEIAPFSPYIYVEHALRTPTSITAAAITGARWRFVEIPREVLKRNMEAQRGWIAWRIRQHFRESNGVCFLFGAIMGYRWQCDTTQCQRFDTRGNIIE